MSDFNVFALLSTRSAMSKPPLPRPVVVHVSGAAGIGKTRWLTALADSNPGALRITTPKRIGQSFDIATAGFDGHAALAIDEVLQWDRSTLLDGIAALEKQAVAASKTLILITQGEKDLTSLGLRFSTSPYRIRLGSKSVRSLRS